MWEGLIEWLGNCELESEIVEVLSIAVLAKSADVVSSSRLRAAIQKPSLLADLFLQEIAGSPIEFQSWIKGHSGECPQLFVGKEEAKELAAGQIVPPILSSQLKRLEKTSRRPFRRQWAFEFQRLADTFGPQSDGHWQYFINDDRERSTGQFITRRGHLARSAYLRTLAAAVDCWGMPEEVAYDAAMYASPMDLAFASMIPGDRPGWISASLGRVCVDDAGWGELIGAIDGCVKADARFQRLLYLNAPLVRSDLCKVDVEIISTLCSKGASPKNKEVWRLHNFLPGQVEMGRDENHEILIDPVGDVMHFPIEGGGTMIPCLLPAVVRHVGYMHADLIKRMPFLPINQSEHERLIAKARLGGMDLIASGVNVGVLEHWNYLWSPTHDRALGPECGTSVRVSTSLSERFLNVPDMTLMRHWRVTVLRREQSYGSWEQAELEGCLDDSQ